MPGPAEDGAGMAGWPMPRRAADGHAGGMTATSSTQGSGPVARYAGAALGPPATAGPAIQDAGLHNKSGRVAAPVDVSFTVCYGRITGFPGPDGAGGDQHAADGPGADRSRRGGTMTLRQAWPQRGQRGTGPAAAALNAGLTAVGTRPPARYGRRAAGVIRWRPRAPRASFRQRVAGWRARNWRRAVLTWFVLSLAIMAVAAEPRSYFPKAQARSVPALRTVLRVAGGVTVAGVPVLLIALP
jgi:hypothetical protein